MKDGFYVFVDADGRLIADEIRDGNAIKHIATDTLKFLFATTEFDFAAHQQFVDGLLMLEIFKEQLDIKYVDFDDCREYCRIAVEGANDPVGRYFSMREFARVESIPDDGSASYFIYQARRMVHAVELPIEANAFLNNALLIFYAGDGTKEQRIKRFFEWYPNLRDHFFEETAEFEGDKLHRRKHIRSQIELYFFALLSLVERDVLLRRCECCGGYFRPKTKKKTLYCDRVIKDGKTCKEIAPQLKRKLRKDPVLIEYERVYDLNYSRMGRYESRRDATRERTERDVTQAEFWAWSSRVTELRRRYVAGDVSAEELRSGLAIGGS